MFNSDIRQTGETVKTFIIAEAGVNHNGDIRQAKKLIDIAVNANVDAVKFQAWKAERIVTRHASKAQYQKETTTPDETQFDMLKKIELSDDSQKELFDYSNKCGIRFLSSPFDLESIDLLNSMGLSCFKIPSGEITNLPYLRKVGKLGKKLILSTGMSNLGEIEKALSVLVDSGTNVSNIGLLHCNTEYPTPMSDVNLLAIQTMGKAFPDVKIGYSDHTLGIEISIAAVALGATIIEKHFTLDRNMKGPDHKASLEPSELKQMVRSIRNVEEALGDGKKKPSNSEKKNMIIARKSIVAASKIKKGDIYTASNLCIKRPGKGISPMYWDDLLGKRAIKNFKIDELIVTS